MTESNAADTSGPDLLSLIVSTAPVRMPKGYGHLHLPETAARALPLLKASVLYGDSVRWINEYARIVAKIVSLVQQSTEPGALTNGSNPAVQALLEEAGRTPDQMKNALANFAAGVRRVPPPGSKLSEQAIADFTAQLDQALERSGAFQITSAIAAGEIIVPQPSIPAEYGAKSRIDRWVYTLIQALSDEKSVPVLDEGSGNLISAINERTDFGLPARSEGTLGTGLLALLPTFEEIPMDEILDIRRDAAVPLRAYRATVARLSAESSQVTDERELRALWRREVAPALADVDEHFKSATFLRQLRPLLSQPRDLLVRGGIAFAVGAGSSRSAVIGAATGVGAACVDAATRAQENKKVQRKEGMANQFYLLRVIRDRTR